MTQPTTPVPTICRWVIYTLNEQDAEQVNRRRVDAENHMDEHRRDRNGKVVHVGNRVEAGQQLPMLIVRVWGDQPDSAVNGQVHLDGNDVLWVTSRSVGEGPGHFSWPMGR